MALILAFLAAFFCAFNNLFMRKSIDTGGSSKGFLVASMSFAFVMSIFLGPMRAGFFHWNHTIAMAGCITGLFMGVMMWALGKALEKGPPGLTIAYLNASTVVPSILMMLLFGVAFGYRYGWSNALGSTLVISGLFWAVWKHAHQTKSQSFWLIFSTLAFLTHVVFLMLLQWRALIITPGLPLTRLVPFTIDPLEAEWFMPMLFMTATLFLLYRFKKEGEAMPKGSEVRFGLYGGICNGTSTYILIKAAQHATPIESAMLFPLFSVGIVLLCNIWGRLLYKENVHWKAMSLCVLGIFIGTVNWASFVA